MRRVVVQRCPQVPTAPNTMARIAISKLAWAVTMRALFPPNSSSERPKRLATASLTFLPIRVEPVADTKGTRLSLAISAPILASPIMVLKIPSGSWFSRSTSLAICWQARAVSGVFSEGFQIHTSPHTAANMAFQDHTATGKLKAEIMPTTPSGWYCSYMRWSGRSECMVRP